MNLTRIAVACVALLSLAGCKDKAEPDLKRCQQLEKDGNVEEALVACEAAHAADPQSAAGEEAIKLEIKLRDKVQAARRAKAAQDAKDAEEAKADEAISKVNFMLESTPPKDPKGYSEKCMADDRAYENSYSCTPKDPGQAKPDDPFPFKAECMIAAGQKGCKPMHPENPDKYFCCTK